jgi:prolyl oligopeptidase PreP (S9A serine peptidase family)
MEFVKATWALLIFLMALPASAWAPGTPPAPARKVDTVDHELVGGAITRAPEAFGAAIMQAGELNPTRLEAAPNGANQFAEVGDPHTSEGLHMTAAMDPYQRIKDATAYPAVLLIVGLNDNRVAPWASGKFGARLAAATNGQRPIWFRTDADMGAIHRRLPRPRRCFGR